MTKKQVNVKRQRNNKKIALVALAFTTTIGATAYTTNAVSWVPDSIAYAEQMMSSKPKESKQKKTDKKKTIEVVDRTEVKHHDIDVDPQAVAKKQNDQLIKISEKNGTTPSKIVDDDSKSDSSTSKSKKATVSKGSNKDESKDKIGSWIPKSKQRAKAADEYADVPVFNQEAKRTESAPVASSTLTKTLVTNNNDLDDNSDISTVTGDEASFKNEIIHRESTFNPYAENGQYVGLGQLDRNYYPVLIGKTWDQVKGNKRLQSIAMDKYVAGRYGTYKKALEFWNSHNWY
ncbi:organic radical activating enzyme [Weissella uvarum]|uniref:aggregation-promoting factor C-terminal-like domain-containing protein n=1 Tax=Weissella uvarum TaxID=1479233 RepID=UPI001961EFE2|nr:hypothetical protein [Weissella uvarum]MBM7617878.1 organic radical activating enzyme [Weissella uvarum]MCM0596124.1 hypothetical protein [Weissella uvarum]